jgi:hypothetical protein
MFDEYNFDGTEVSLQQHQANLSRLVEIQDELRTLVQARDRLLRDLTILKATLETHRQAGSVIRLRAMQILNRLSKQVEEGTQENQLLDSDDERLIHELDASRAQLEKDVDLTERRLKIAQFEADTLAGMLDDLEDQVAQIAADLDGEEGISLNERN